MVKKQVHSTSKYTRTPDLTIYVSSFQVNYVLFETASGYALFERLQSEEIGAKLEEVQDTVQDLVKFGKMMKLKSFAPFKNAADALENANDVSEGSVLY